MDVKLQENYLAKALKLTYANHGLHLNNLTFNQLARLVLRELAADELVLMDENHSLGGTEESEDDDL